MKAAFLKRLKRLEEVQAIENLPPTDYQIGYLNELPPEYTGDRHIVTVGRDPHGTYRWEERRGPEPADKGSSIPPFKVVLTSPEEDPAPAHAYAVARGTGVPEGAPGGPPRRFRAGDCALAADSPV